jgi:hypothetical protein
MTSFFLLASLDFCSALVVWPANSDQRAVHELVAEKRTPEELRHGRSVPGQAWDASDIDLPASGVFFSCSTRQVSRLYLEQFFKTVEPVKRGI